MRQRHEPVIATWLLKLFCSGPERESVTGDLLEQYQNGRSLLWYWRQVLAIVVLGRCRARRSLISNPHTPVFSVMLFVAVVAAVLLSDIWPILLVGVLGGIFAGLVAFGARNAGKFDAAGRDLNQPAPILPASLHVDTALPAAKDLTAYHRGISISRIPVEGAAGFLFVFATGFIFAVGVPAIREILVVTVPMGILASGFLLHWHRRHPREIQALDLYKKKR